MTRSQLREHTFKMLFSREFEIGATRGEQRARYFIMEEEISDKDRAYILERCALVEEKVEAIDSLLTEKAEKWKVSRMNKVDLTILRLAYFECAYDDDIPTGVAINEAVELAKKYSSDEAPAFVNGVMAKLIG